MPDVTPRGVLHAIIVAAIIGIVGVQLLASPVFDASATASQTQTDLEVLDNSGDLEPGLFSSSTSVDTVQSSLRDQARLTGAADSQVAISDIELNTSWSVCTYTRADASVESGDENRTLLAIEYLTLTYNGSADTWNLYYYDIATRAWYHASTPAPSPANNTLVCGYGNATHVGVSQNTSVATAPIDGTPDIAPGNLSNWDGVVEETRVFNRWLTDGERSAWLTQPVVSVPGEPPQARVTYDVWTRPSHRLPVYFNGGDAGLRNASLVDGYPGPNLTRGTDYTVDGGVISVPAGSVLEGDGEVLYVAWVPGSVEFPVGLIALGLALFILAPLAVKVIEVTQG